MTITNTNPLIRFNKIREVFPSVTRVLSILLTTADTSASVNELILKRAYLSSKRLASGNQRFLVRVQLPAMRRVELPAAITWLMSQCL